MLGIVWNDSTHGVHISEYRTDKYPKIETSINHAGRVWPLYPLVFSSPNAETECKICLIDRSPHLRKDSKSLEYYYVPGYCLLLRSRKRHHIIAILSYSPAARVVGRCPSPSNLGHPAPSESSSRRTCPACFSSSSTPVHVIKKKKTSRRSTR